MYVGEGCGVHRVASEVMASDQMSADGFGRLLEEEYLAKWRKLLMAKYLSRVESRGSRKG